MSENDNNRQSLKQKLAARMGHIKGWGVDANPKNDPTYPLRRRFEGDSAGATWERPQQQSGHDDILHSNERPDVTRVFGTSAPVQGFSGSLRRCAFKYSEGRFAHWLLLLMADRINMVEGFASDLIHGRGVQCVNDMGIKARWEHDRKNLVTEAAIGAAVVGILAAVCLRRHGPPTKRTLGSLMHKQSRIQSFLNDYHRLMGR